MLSPSGTESSRRKPDLIGIGREATIRTPAKLQKAEGTLRLYGLAFPEAVEEFPWGERALKVRGKIFVVMYQSPDGFTFTTKLPHSSGAALMFSFAQPTGYGLGRSGWVTAKFGLKDTPPVPLLKAWILESYQAVAPKKLAAQGLPE